MFNVRKLLLADNETMKQKTTFSPTPVGENAAINIHKYTIAITQLLERGLTLEASRIKKKIYTA